MTDFQTISSGLAGKIAGISGIQVVYEYEPDVSTDGQYPFATITPKNFEGSFGDVNRNLRTYTFSVKVYQERVTAGAGNQKAERLIREMADELLTAFDADITLSGRVQYVKPVRGDFTYVDREMGDTRIAEFIIDAVNIENTN